MRCLLAVLVRSDLSKDVELLVLREENKVLRRQVGSRSRWDHADWLWLTALSRFAHRRHWAEITRSHRPRPCAGTVPWSQVNGPPPTGVGQDDRPPACRSRR